ncbi:MAG: DNA polymerase II large subunit [Euryarchaeota archaeon RBG_16_67_27]|nr:MAG: DNA polymerase II large subunit [Euryarchaeota archaeon RBG_16_67_27]
MELGSVVVSEDARRYFDGLREGVEACYRVARAARAKGFDPELDVETPLTEDLASRVERLLKDYDVEGVARRIRELAKVHDREELAIVVAKEMARRPAPSRERAVERAVRVGLAILTEGILVAPLEGLADVKVKRNADGSTYVDLFYAGPIRSAGGTGQALSVLIADVVRRELGIGRWQPTRPEVERFKEEIPLYKQIQHLQYTPTDGEIELIAANCPVGLNGEGTEDAEISGHRDLPRIETNRIRGGACLVIADGMCLKAPKIQKHVSKLRIDGWEFLDAYLKGKADHPDQAAEDHGLEPSEKFIQNIVAGRPVLCHPSRPGGLRLRYGRTRATGLAALALHPATMHILDDFIAVGTQIKTERPGKAGAVTPCDRIEGPLVVLDSGDFVEVSDVAMAKRLGPSVRVIADLGEILIPFGEFLENNHLLVPGAFSLEWYGQILEAKLGTRPRGWESTTPEQALAWSRDLQVPLHPRYNLFWHDLTVEELKRLRQATVDDGRLDEGRLSLRRDEELKELLVRLGATHGVREDRLVLDRHTEAFLACLGIERTRDGLQARGAPEDADPLAFVSSLAGFPVKARGPTRIGARMARPEKAAPRKMQPAPHSLFPIGLEGGPQRLLTEAAKRDVLEVEVGLRICTACGKRWFLPRCSCGGHTVARNGPARQRIPIADVLRIALESLGEPMPSEIKAVQGMISKTKTPEPLEKGILRAKHGIFVFKDGTTRYDMTNLPLTHVTPREAEISVATARRLGYGRDARGAPLERDDQVLELRTQDILVAESCGDYLVHVAAFVDDLLEKVYGLPRFYRASSREDLLGHLVLTLAPHTSGGVLARIVGFTKARACFAHPYLIAARRRNCDGDEDSVILLLDSLVNFSRSFLPAKRGGLMDAPLVLTLQIDPNEIDKEAHNLDLSPVYPLALYEGAERFAHPKEVEPLVDTVGRRIGSVLQYEGFGYTTETTDVAAGPLESAYVEGSMIEKMDKQLELALKIRAVDANDVVSRIVVHHFLPDLIGNLKAFSSQQVRCTKCGEKYRRIPLRGRCPSCGGNLTLTVHESSVKKYLEVTKKITQQYDVSNYLRQRIGLVEEAITSLFTNEKVQALKLDDFF